MEILGRRKNRFKLDEYCFPKILVEQKKGKNCDQVGREMRE
jgi:hypothetical protein